MVGGEDKAFERARPVFEKMGKNITLVGGNGVGQTTKVANQIVVALTIEAVAEALVFASKAGADPAKVRQALMGGLAASRILEVHGERMVKRTFAPGFRIELHQKDLESGAGRGKGTRRLPAQHLDHAAAFQFLRGQWRRQGGSFGAGAGAGAHGRPRGSVDRYLDARGSSSRSHRQFNGLTRKRPISPRGSCTLPPIRTRQVPFGGIKAHCRRIRHIQRADRAEHVEPGQRCHGFASLLAQALALGPQHEGNFFSCKTGFQFGRTIGIETDRSGSRHRGVGRARRRDSSPRSGRYAPARRKRISPAHPIRAGCGAAW